MAKFGFGQWNEMRKVGHASCSLAAVVAALGAAAVASAILMILELSDPYSGVFRMRDAVFEAITGAVGSR